jgi:hypothetical protein
MVLNYKADLSVVISPDFRFSLSVVNLRVTRKGKCVTVCRTDGVPHDFTLVTLQKGKTPPRTNMPATLSVWRQHRYKVGPEFNSMFMSLLLSHRDLIHIFKLKLPFFLTNNY